MKPEAFARRQLAAARQAIRAVAARSTVHDVQHGGVRMRWRRWGTGAPLVLLHGGHGSWMHWLRNVEALAARHAVWAPDLPGFGDSDALPGDPHRPERQEQLLDVLQGTLRQLVGDASRFDLAGFSFGGLVAAQLAARSPQARRLALLGPTAHQGRRRQERELVNWRLPEAGERLAAHAHNLRTLMLSDHAQADAQALLAHMCSSRATRYRSKSFSRGCGLQEALRAVEGDVLLLWGEHDVTAFPAEVAPSLVDGRANRTVQVIPGSGHWVQYEAGPAINDCLLQWFAQPGRHA